MADIKYYDVILKPIITEKSMDAMSEKKYTFLVHTEATKSQIKEAVDIGKEDLIICADNSFSKALAENIKPDLIIGDFDTAAFDPDCKSCCIELSECHRTFRYGATFVV